MPESFSERDLYRVLYPSRLEKVEVPDEVKTPPVSNDVSKQAEAAASISQGNNQAAKTPAAPIKTTGASLSGQSVIKK
jgi:hypothetical protein